MPKTHLFNRLGKGSGKYRKLSIQIEQFQVIELSMENQQLKMSSISTI